MKRGVWEQCEPEILFRIGRRVLIVFAVRYSMAKIWKRDNSSAEGYYAVFQLRNIPEGGKAYLECLKLGRVKMKSVASKVAEHYRRNS